MIDEDDEDSHNPKPQITTIFDQEDEDSHNPESPLEAATWRMSRSPLSSENLRFRVVTVLIL